VPWKHRPQQRQDSLVREDRLPWRLDPLRGRSRQRTAEGLLHHPFPGIELEGEVDGFVLQVDEGALAVLPMSVMARTAVSSPA